METSQSNIGNQPRLASKQSHPKDDVKFCLLMVIWWIASLWIFLHFNIARTP